MSRKKDKLVKPPGNNGVSRRDFLRGAGVAVSGSLVAVETAQAKSAAGAATPILGPGKVPITLRVQDMEMETALKWILRLAELKHEFRNQAVFITAAKPGEPNPAAAVEKKGEQKAPPPAPRPAPEF